MEGELAGDFDEVRLDDPLAADGRVTVALAFRRAAPRPGVHALALRLDYEDQAGHARSQRAWLMLSFDAAAPEANVELAAADTVIGTAALVPVKVRMRDGRSRRVRLRLLAPRGLQAPDPPAIVEVPAGGTVAAPLRLLRSGAPRPSEHGVVVLADWDDDGRAGAAAATARVRVGPDPAVLPRARRWIAALGVALLLYGAAREIRRWRAAGG